MTDITPILQGLNYLKQTLEQKNILQEFTGTAASLQINYAVSMDRKSAFVFATIVDNYKIPLMIHSQTITDPTSLDGFKMTVEKELKDFIHHIFVQGINEACVPQIFKD